MTVKDYSRIFVRYDLVTESPYYSIKRVAGENTAIQKVLESVILGDTENIEEVVNAALRELDPVEVIWRPRERFMTW